jgi:single-strand DNA-binding protein
MNGYSKVILMGNLTRDVELRFSTKGTAVGKFCLAVNRQWKSETGEKKEEVTFIDIDCFGKQAETLAQYVKKGSPLFVEGRLKLDSWDDKATGQKRSRLGVVLEGFQFIGGTQDTPKEEKPLKSNPGANAGRSGDKSQSETEEEFSDPPF